LSDRPGDEQMLATYNDIGRMRAPRIDPLLITSETTPKWQRQALVPEMNCWRGKSARVLFTNSGIAVFHRALLSALWKDDASYRNQRFTFCRPAGHPARPRFGVCNWLEFIESIDFAKPTSIRRRRVIPLPVRQREAIRTMPLSADSPPACKT